MEDHRGQPTERYRIGRTRWIWSYRGRLRISCRVSLLRQLRYCIQLEVHDLCAGKEALSGYREKCLIP
jgi:hypothetical protein